MSCDHLATGDSTHPEDVLSLTYEQLAAANHATAVAILDQLRSGTFEPGIPAIDVRAAMGMGQSMGGCLLTVQQANHRTFDGVAFLGVERDIHRIFLLPTAPGSPIPCRGWNRPRSDR